MSGGADAESYDDEEEEEELERTQTSEKYKHLVDDVLDDNFSNREEV
jgi:hypothetical protein